MNVFYRLDEAVTVEGSIALVVFAAARGLPRTGQVCSSTTAGFAQRCGPMPPDPDWS